MAHKTRAELLNALTDAELVPGDFRSAFALMYAYLTGPDEHMDDAIAEAVANAHTAILFRESLRDLRARTMH
jgi:hypothetical protein